MRTRSKILIASGLAAFGHLLVATIIATFAALTDILDGSMARARGTASRFGAFLDSSMDRIADGAMLEVDGSAGTVTVLDAKEAVDVRAAAAQ